MFLAKERIGGKTTIIAYGIDLRGAIEGLLVEKIRTSVASTSEDIRDTLKRFEFCEIDEEDAMRELAEVLGERFRKEVWIEFCWE